jgi:hypothetical protein
MTYRSRGRSLFEVILVSINDSNLSLVVCGILPTGSGSRTYKKPYPKLLFLTYSVLSSPLPTSGNLLCMLFGWVYYGSLHWKLFPSQASAGETTAAATGEISSFE